MSRKHFLLYDFLLPLSGILLLGAFFSDRFDTFVFRWLDSVRFLGLGSWFGHSPVREVLWNYSWLAFAAAPAAAWLVWFRINLEYDWVNAGRRLDRPIFAFFLGLFRWIEGGGEIRLLREAYERRLAAESDRVRRLEAELAGTFGSSEDFEAPQGSEAEWQDGYRPPYPQG